MSRRKLHPTIGLLMAAIAMIAVALACLRVASDQAASVVFTTVVAATGLSLVGALTVDPTQRAGWVGFSVLASGYLVLAFGPWLNTEVRPYLLSTPLLDRLYVQIHHKPVLSRAFAHPMLYAYDDSGKTAIESSDHFLQTRGAAQQVNHERIGHSIVAMLLGLLGVGVGRFLRPQRAETHVGS